VCEILLLYELLKRRRPDLNLERAESLLSLVGRRRSKLLPPPKAGVREVIKQGLDFATQARIGFKDPIDVMAETLRIAPAVLPVESEQAEVQEREIARESVDLLAGPVARPYASPPGLTEAELLVKKDVDNYRKRFNQLMLPLSTPRGREIAREVACVALVPIAFKAITAGHPLVKAGGALALLGCGVEISGGLEIFR
jgi:hypothetical protein